MGKAIIDKKKIKNAGKALVCFLLAVTLSALVPEQIKVFAKTQTVPDKVLSTAFEDLGEYNIVCGKKKQWKLP